nr:hypothetical protein [uncultured Allomuricauda sp.]
MYKRLLFLILTFILLATSSTIAQFTYETGYFIDVQGNKVSCLIENRRWLYSPKEVNYKLSEDSEIQKFTVENCQEFRIGNEGTFKRVKASFPITQSKLKKRENTPQPEMVQLEVFVQTIVEGAASLFWYVDDNGIVYSYSKEDGPITPLIYKKYVLEDQQVRENSMYKTQLIRDFTCGNAPIIQKTKYQRKSLIQYFEYLNTCFGNNNFIVYERRAKQKANFFIGFKVWAGLEQNQYEARTRNPERIFEFENTISSKFGGEIEAFFPYFGYKKVSLFLSGQFSQTDNSIVFPESVIGDNAYNADYSIFELQIGARYYLDLSAKSSLFVEGALATDFFGNSTISADRTIRIILEEDRMETQEIGTSYKNRLGGSFGLGYSFNRRFYLRAAIRTNQVVLDETIFFEDTLSRMSVSLGYSLF